MTLKEYFPDVGRLLAVLNGLIENGHDPPGPITKQLAKLGENFSNSAKK